MDVRQGFTVEGGVELDAAVEFATDHGFDFLELNMENGFARRDADPAEIRTIVDSAGLDLVVHLPYRLDVGSPHEEVRLGTCRELERSIDAALDFGATRGVFHAAALAAEGEWEDDVIRTQIRRSVDRVTEYGESRGFLACVENLKGPFFDVGNSEWLLRESESEVSLCLDTGHAHATGHDVAWQSDFIRQWGDRIEHIHLNDTRRPDNDEHLPVGVGMLDFELLVDAMRDTAWSGTCTHEVYAPELGPERFGKAVFDELLNG